MSDGLLHPVRSAEELILEELRVTNALLRDQIALMKEAQEENKRVNDIYLQKLNHVEPT